MSQENVEIARGFIEAYAAGAGIERALSVFSPDVVLYPFPDWVEASVYRGHEGVRRLTAVWADTFDDFAIAPEEVRDLGDRVVILGHTTGRIKGTGVPIRQPVGPSQRAVASFGTTRWAAGQPTPNSSVSTVSETLSKRALYML